MSRPIDHALISAAAHVLRRVESGSYPDIDTAIASLVADGVTLEYRYPGIPDDHWVREHWYLSPDDAPMLTALIATIEQGYESNADVWSVACELMEKNQ